MYFFCLFWFFFFFYNFIFFSTFFIFSRHFLFVKMIQRWLQNFLTLQKLHTFVLKRRSNATIFNVCIFFIIKIVLQFWNYGISLVGRDLRIRTRDLQQLRGWYALFKT
jgi:hypothetical protein